MELVYVSRAIKRYWWVTAAFVILGTLAGALASPSLGDMYETEARVQVLGDSSGTSNDRDVQNQLVLLDSTSLAETVAADVGDISAADVRNAVTFSQIPSSDVIKITATYGDAETAQAIANGYVDAYIGALREQVEGTQAPDLESLNEGLAQLEAQLDDIDAQIEQALAPYIGVDAAVLPTIDQVDPALATERQVLLEEYLERLRRRNELQLAGLSSELPSQTTQSAALPTEPIGGGVSLRLIAGPFVGVLLGVLASVALARLSPRILDAEDATEILGLPLAGQLSRHGVPEDPSLVLTEPLPSEFVSTIHDIAVRAEANATSSSLTIAVAGADRAAGATTIAAGLARHFAAQSAQVLLIDADSNNCALSRAFDEGVSGVRMLLRTDANGVGRRNSGSRPRLHGTPLANLRFAGLADGDSVGIRRQDVPALLDVARGVAQVVIIDCGALMDAASSVQMTQSVDTVVLAFAPKQQSERGLTVVARQLSAAQGLVLPVATQGRRMHLFSRSTSSPSPAPRRESDRDAPQAAPDAADEPADVLP